MNKHLKNFLTLLLFTMWITWIIVTIGSFFAHPIETVCGILEMILVAMVIFYVVGFIYSCHRYFIKKDRSKLTEAEKIEILLGRYPLIGIVAFVLAIMDYFLFGFLSAITFFLFWFIAFGTPLRKHMKSKSGKQL